MDCYDKAGLAWQISTTGRPSASAIPFKWMFDGSTYDPNTNTCKDVSGAVVACGAGVNNYRQVHKLAYFFVYTQLTSPVVHRILPL